MTEENVSPEAQEATEGQAQEATEEAVDATQVVAEDSQVEEAASDADTDDAGLQREREARRKANREAQNLRERLRKFEEAEEKRKQEAMSELEKAQSRAEKLQQERDEVSKAAESARAELRALRVSQAATSKALQAGAKQDRLDAVLRLTDLADVTDEDGNPDSKAIESAIKATLKTYPEFRSGAKDIGGPSNPPGEANGGSKSVANMTDEEIAQLSQRAQWGERVTLS